VNERDDATAAECVPQFQPWCVLLVCLLVCIFLVCMLGDFATDFLLLRQFPGSRQWVCRPERSVLFRTVSPADSLCVCAHTAPHWPSSWIHPTHRLALLPVGAHLCLNEWAVSLFLVGRESQGRCVASDGSLARYRENGRLQGRGTSVDRVPCRVLQLLLCPLSPSQTIGRRVITVILNSSKNSSSSLVLLRPSAPSAGAQIARFAASCCRRNPFGRRCQRSASRTQPAATHISHTTQRISQPQQAM
jgi:hypothetical protein